MGLTQHAGNAPALPERPDRWWSPPLVVSEYLAAKGQPWVMTNAHSPAVGHAAQGRSAACNRALAQHPTAFSDTDFSRCLLPAATTFVRQGRLREPRHEFRVQRSDARRCRQASDARDAAPRARDCPAPCDYLAGSECVLQRK